MTTRRPVFCLLLRVSSDYAQPITGQVTKVTCLAIGRAQYELTPSKGQKMGPVHQRLIARLFSLYFFFFSSSNRLVRSSKSISSGADRTLSLGTDGKLARKSFASGGGAALLGGGLLRGAGTGLLLGRELLESSRGGGTGGGGESEG